MKRSSPRITVRWMTALAALSPALLANCSGGDGSADTSAGEAISSQFTLRVSASANRSSSTLLQGANLNGLEYVFTSDSTGTTQPAGIKQVSYWLDNTSMSGTPTHVEHYVPYDFAGTASGGTADPWDVTKVAAGTHTISQSVVPLAAGAPSTYVATFTIGAKDAGTDTGVPDSGGGDSHVDTGALDSGVGSMDGATGPVPRPSYNTGNGFYVVGNKIYDPNGLSFRVRGLDKNHLESAYPMLANTHANTVRVFGATVLPWFDVPADVSYVEQLKANREVPIIAADSLNPSNATSTAPLCPGTWYTYSAGPPAVMTQTSGNTDPALLHCVVQNAWVANASSWTTFNSWAMFNIANEWGPSAYRGDGATWSTAVQSAIVAMRAAGYLAPLVVDSGMWGQDPGNFLSYGQAVFDSDPQKNVIFSIHIYGGWCDSLGTPAAPCNTGGFSNSVDLQPTLAKLAALPFPVIVGEFGPGRNVGPSPTMVDPRRIVQVSEAEGLGYAAWAIDDNDAANSSSNNLGFALVYKDGVYGGASNQLTIYGQEYIQGCLNPAPAGCGCPDSPQPSYSSVGPFTCAGTPAPRYSGQGLLQLATPATSF